MSADEIRKLAEDCEKEARHIDEDAGVAFSYGDLRMKDVFDEISKTERKKAAALLAYAAMVERCENEQKHNEELRDASRSEILKMQYAEADYALQVINYILHGDAGKEEI